MGAMAARERGAHVWDKAPPLAGSLYCAGSGHESTTCSGEERAWEPEREEESCKSEPNPFFNLYSRARCRR